MSETGDDAAASQLAREQMAQSFEMPDVPFFDDVGEAPSFSPPRDRDEDQGAPAREKNRSGTILALEDLYTQYPALGKGEWKLRISRLEPKAFKGQAISGFLCEVYERLSMPEFGRRFGGGFFSITVMRPTSPNESTLSDFRAVREIRIRVAGDPVVGGESPIQFHSDGSKAVSNQVEMQRLHVEERERERLHAERLRAEEKADRLQREVVPNFYETTKRVVEDSQRLTGAQIEFWKEEADRLRSEVMLVRSQAAKDLQERDQDNRKLHEDIITLKQQATATTLAVETKVIQDLKIQYEARISELKDQASTQLRETRERFDEDRRRMQEEFSKVERRMQEDHSKKVDDLTADHRRIMEDIMRRHDEERRNYESAQSIERERVREDTRFRMEQLTQQKENEVRQLRDTYDQRIADLRLSTDRELQSVRDATAREIESIRQSERAQSTLARESAEMRKESVKAEETRLRQEITELRRENGDLRDRLDQERARQHKDLPTAIREAREMAGHLGLVDPGEIEKPESEPSTMSQFLGLARQAFDAAPQVLDKIMQARKEQADQIVQAQQMQQMQQAQAAAQARQAQMLAAQQAPRQLGAPAQQQARQAAPPGRYAPPSQARAGQPGQPRQTAPVQAPPMGSYQPPAVSPVPFGPPPVVAVSPVQSPSLAPEQATVPQAALPAGAESEAVVGSGVPVAPSGSDPEPQGQDTNSLIIQFFQQLDAAIRNKVLSPESFAIAVISQVGPETTGQLLAQFRPEEIVETAQQLSPDTAIGTRDGQKYVRELWRVAAIKVAERGAPA